MSKATKKKSSKKRSGSEAAQFDQKTIQEFKEAFGIMDQDKDGVISKSDLKDLYASMGQIASDKQIDDMIAEASGPLNFTVFLTLFGERLTGTDPEATIVGAFQMFDKTDSGKISEEQLVKILQNKRGEPLDDDEMKAMYKGNPPLEGGTDPEATIVGAFQMFDKTDSGKISEEQLVKILQNKRGEPLDDDEMKAMYKGNPPLEGGQVDYKAFAHLITTGAQEELASA
uniref:EF-hand n=1 Tax=Steinernema glaseri TaxID=37863 RepID=A0A1I7ZQV2_9BILA